MEAINEAKTNNAMAKIKKEAPKIGEALHEVGKQASDMTMQVLSDLSESGRDLIKGCQHEGKRQLQNVEDMVRQYPFRSILISAATGLLLSRFIK